jgi:hypothetical protein
MTDTKHPLPLIVHPSQNTPAGFGRLPSVQEGIQVVAWACGTCGRVHMHESNAAYCHGIKKCEDCGIEMSHDRTYTACDACLAKHEIAKEKERFDKAEKLTSEEYIKSVSRDVVYCENVHADVGHGDMGEDYWSSIDELECACADAGVTLPDYVYACTEHVPFIDASNVVEHALEDTYENAVDDVPDAQLAVLQKFLDTWWRATGIVYYSEDPKRVIVLNPKAGN